MFPSLPKMFHLSQRYPASRSLDVGAILREGFDRKSLGPEIHPGMRVAVGVGSRGITNLAEIVRSVINLLRTYGAEPFIIPAMGSHGGATPSGQQNLLAGFGVTPESTDGFQPPFCSTRDRRADGVRTRLGICTDARAFPVFRQRDRRIRRTADRPAC